MSDKNTGIDPGKLTGPIPDGEPDREIAIGKVIEALATLYPRLPESEYQNSFISEMVDKMVWLGEKHAEGRGIDVLALNYKEGIGVKYLNSVAKQIETDILEKEIPYESMACIDREPKNEFERGVFAAMGLIRHRVHCICD